MPNPIPTIWDGTINGMRGHITAKYVPRNNPFKMLPNKGNIIHYESHSGIK